jgi:hypothetical protein
MFLWDAWQDLTLIILMIAAVASLALGIKTEVSFGGEYNRLLSGFCIAVECDVSEEGSLALIFVIYGALLSLQDNSICSIVVSKNYVSQILFSF